MILKIEKGVASGRINAPASKSMAHRLLICAALCHGQKSVIHGIDPCEDVLATIDCLRAMGARIEYDGNSATVFGADMTKACPALPLNCRESGSTLRFLIPIAMLSGSPVTMAGSGRLMERSQSVYEKLAEERGLRFEKEEGKILLQGPLTAGEYHLDGGVSSQFISGMLFALSALRDDSKIIISGRLESEPYVNLTVDAMAEYGVNICRDGDSFYIKGGQEYRGGERQVEGDWSNGAFLDALRLVGGDVEIGGLNSESHQGDRVYREHFLALNGGFNRIDISSCPDLGPILFALAAVLNGGEFVGTRRLRDKESDRVAAMEGELKKFGAELIVEENSVTVLKRELHAPSTRLCGHNDHRIVMSLSVLCTLFGGEIEGCEAVSKSYPDFFEDIKALGIRSNEIN